ncbi:MAG: Lrp/AsnC family transcriptional regulator [Erysipelotrichia bacterium]|nr:Lrp/AsnC family transcriptional regulator [Erysipelotrichia bacterium]NCC54383.1 Lrp/AsnC family transcriptional regulator [Erysipelotrichia bacterium]
MNELQLLSLLEKDARMSANDLATILQEEESVVLETLNDLEKEKVICGYHTIINWDKTNKERVSAIIFADATPEREYGYDRIAKKIYNYPEVESMHLMSGKSDFLIMLHAQTMKEVAEFTATKLACIEGITATSTLFVLQTYKANDFILMENEEKRERLVVTP